MFDGITAQPAPPSISEETAELQALLQSAIEMPDRKREHSSFGFYGGNNQNGCPSEHMRMNSSFICSSLARQMGYILLEKEMGYGCVLGGREVCLLAR